MNASARIDVAQPAFDDLRHADEPINGLEPLAAKVVHADSTGLGVVVDRLSGDWLSFLQRAGDRPLADTKSANREYEALVQRCISVYAAFLKTFARDALARASDSLGAAAGSDPFMASRSGFDSALIALREHSRAIVEQFVADCSKRVAARSERDQSFEAATALRDLRLMHADELEEFLALSGVIKRIEEHVGVALDQFEMRYVRLIGTPIIAKKDPFGPQKTLHSLRNALATAQLSLPSARLVYREVEAIAIARFPDLLRDLNQVLAAVTPGARPLLRSRSGTGPAAMSLPMDAMPDEATQQLIDTLREKRWSGGGRIPRAVLDVITSLINGSDPEKLAGQNGGLSLLPMEEHGAGDTEATLPELLAAIDRLPMSTGGAFEQANVDQVLAQMQPAGAETGNESGIHDASRNAVRLGQGHKHVLDTTARLFAQASHDFVPQSDVELLMKRLERTLLKLSLRDGEFPSSPAHPARKVVNLIDQYNFAANDDGRLSDVKLRRNLDSLVTRICEQADHDATVFSVVQHSLEQDLEGLRRERRVRIDRVVEALESRDQVRVVRRYVDKTLSARLAGRRVARVLVRLLDEVWRQHLVMTGLRYGIDSEDWRSALLLIERTLAISVADIDDAAAVALRGELYRELSAELAMIVTDQSLRGSLLLELHALMVDASAESVADVVDAPNFTEPASAAPSVEPTEAIAALSGPLIGDWWDMRIEKKWVPVQLVWASLSTGYRGFVNRSASNRLEMTQTEFQRQLTEGTARVRDSLDIPLLDRSESGLLNEAYTATVQRSDHVATSGLLNRKGFQRRLNELDAQASGGQHHVVGMLECDQFRAISSTCGIDALEELTKALSDKILRRLPKDCAAAMFRDDCFAIVMPNFSRTAGLRTMNELVASVADYHFTYAQHSYRIGVSAGVATFGSGQCGAGEVLRRADAACLAGKSIGRNRVQEYEPDSVELRSEEAMLAWAGRADALLESDALYLRAQMVMPIGPDTSELPYYEILLGIENTFANVNGPYDFILALERLGRSHEIDLWVLRHAFQWVSENWMLMESIAGVSINLSVPSLRHPEIMRFLRQELSRSNFPARKITFEITETAAIRDFDAAEQFIRDIHRYGCGFSLDDFGSGFTSYAHLKRLSTDTLKIDGSYVKDLLLSPSDQAIVKSMTDIGHTLGMKVVAEWVESPGILAKLIELGVDYAQGFAVHKPVRLDRLVASKATSEAAH